MEEPNNKKWVCNRCGRGFKREAYYLKHQSRAVCVAEKDAILMPSQHTSPRNSFGSSPSLSIEQENQLLLLWFDEQVSLLRKSFIDQLHKVRQVPTTQFTKEISQKLIQEVKVEEVGKEPERDDGETDG